MKSWKKIVVILMSLLMLFITPFSIVAETLEVPTTEEHTEIQSELPEVASEEVEETPTVEPTPIVTEPTSTAQPEPTETESVPMVEETSAVEETLIVKEIQVLEGIMDTDTISDTTAQTEDSSTSSTDLERGTFTPTGTVVSTQDATVTASYSMFKVAEAAKVNTYSDGTMTAVITYTGSSFLKMYVGTAEAAATATEGIIEAQFVEEKVYTYEVPLSALDTPIDAAVLSSKGNWKDNTLTITLKEVTPKPTPEPTPEPIQKVPADGTYSATAFTGAAMFKVVDCVLTVKDGMMTAVIALSGTGYDCLYMGTAENAANASDEERIPYFLKSVNGEEKYAYEIPVSVLDEALVVASHSLKNDKWFDRTITIDSSSLKLISTEEHPGTMPEATPTPIPTPTPDVGITDDEELKDMIESIKPGEVKDGTYKPSFGYKGGSGRVTLSCSKVVVKDGKATATIVFGSPNFTYMKVNGTKYYNQNKGGNSTFAIPVKLNGTTSVAAETTAMSTPYEIEYTLYVYVDGTNVSSIKPPAPPASDKEDKKKTDEELAEELALEKAEEENGWGAFDSEQTTDEQNESVDTGDENDKTIDSADLTNSDNEAGSSSMLILVIVIIIAVIAIGAVVVRTYFISKKK